MTLHDLIFAQALLNLSLQALAGFHGKVLRCRLQYNYLNDHLFELTGNTHINTHAAYA